MKGCQADTNTRIVYICTYTERIVIENIFCRYLNGSLFGKLFKLIMKKVKNKIADE